MPRIIGVNVSGKIQGNTLDIKAALGNAHHTTEKGNEMLAYLPKYYTVNEGDSEYMIGLTVLKLKK